MEREQLVDTTYTLVLFLFLLKFVYTFDEIEEGFTDSKTYYSRVQL